MILLAASAPATGGGPSTVLVAIIGALALIIAACMPTLVGRTGRTEKSMAAIRNDARLHRERDDVRFGAIFGVIAGPDGRPLRDPWPVWEDDDSGARHLRGSR